MIKNEDGSVVLSKEAELMHGCEICHKMHGDSELIVLEDIEYSERKRVFPLYVCMKCADKISDALLFKVIKDTELEHYILQAKQQQKEEKKGILGHIEE